MLYALCLLCVVHLVVSQHVDLTISPEAKGEDVVKSVVERIRSNCIFADDRLFLRRLAYVESHDGNDPKTYRKGFDGGIWQVDEALFNATRRCPFIITEECRIIESAFNITWQDTTWSDLRKPLYSGLAASLYMLLRLGFLLNMPGDVTAQADTWSHYYHLNKPTADFVQAAEAVKDTCEGKLDLAFIIDSSGSIYFMDYIHMLLFIQNVTKALNYGPDGTQIAAINFGSHAEVSFHFNKYHDKDAALAAISKIKKDDGGTYTYDALDLATYHVFTKHNGARDGVPRVAILLTDGASKNFNKTVAAAKRAKETGITIFTVGIGSINRDELEAVASEPNCTHLFVLEDFSEIESLLNELRKSSCTAPVTLTTSENNNSTVNATESLTSVTTPLTNVSSTTTIKIDNKWTFAVGGEKIVKAEVRCGVLDIYASYETPNPGPAFFEQKLTATDGHPSILSLVKHEDGRPLYITVIGTKLPTDPTKLDQCVDAGYTISVERKPDVEIWCKEKGVLRQCTKTDYIHAELRPLICDKNSLTSSTLSNPCTPETLQKGLFIHPHPLDSNLFIKCDLTGRMYVTLCPDHETFNKVTMSCGFDSVSVPTGGTSLPSTVATPCTSERIQNKEYFFSYPGDKHKYIQCDIWGGAWVQVCKEHFVWNNLAKTCVEDFLHEFEPTTASPVNIHNPCVVGSGLYFYPFPSDVTKFIHCDVAGNYWVQSCQDHFQYNPIAHVCVPLPGMTGK